VLLWFRSEGVVLPVIGYDTFGRALCWRLPVYRTIHSMLFNPTRGESQAHWEALLNDVYGRGVKGDKLLLVVTDGCPGLAAAIQTVYPRAAHQRWWVHKVRNILEKVRKRDYDSVKADAQAIYLGRWPPPAPSADAGEVNILPWSSNWSAIYPNGWPFSLFPNTCGAN
jgi:transposase-like protein